jgi:hypothetical protein
MPVNYFIEPANTTLTVGTWNPHPAIKASSYTVTIPGPAAFGFIEHELDGVPGKPIRVSASDYQAVRVYKSVDPAGSRQGGLEGVLTCVANGAPAGSFVSWVHAFP